jgi:hypothetical protein
MFIVYSSPNSDYNDLHNLTNSLTTIMLISYPYDLTEAYGQFLIPCYISVFTYYSLSLQLHSLTWTSTNTITPDHFLEHGKTYGYEYTPYYSMGKALLEAEKNRTS